MTSIDLVYFDAGGGHRAAAHALKAVVELQGRPWDLRLVNLQELLSGNPEKNVALQSGDTVYVPPPANVYVTGHVGRPGPYTFEPGMTVYQLLLRAGGVSPRGSSGGIRIIPARSISISTWSRPPPTLNAPCPTPTDSAA